MSKLYGSTPFWNALLSIVDAALTHKLINLKSISQILSLLSLPKKSIIWRQVGTLMLSCKHLKKLLNCPNQLPISFSSVLRQKVVILSCHKPAGVINMWTWQKSFTIPNIKMEAFSKVDHYTPISPYHLDALQVQVNEIYLSLTAHKNIGLTFYLYAKKLYNEGWL